MSSSTTTALSRQPLAQVLKNVEDPRDRRGVRHSLFAVLSLAVTGVLAGCRSLTAIWEHTTDLTATDLEALGLEEGQALPSESTIRRVLQDLDPADVDAHLRSWLCTRAGTINGRRVIAVDGKTMRGARQGQVPAPHLLAALDHATGAVLTQQRVADKSTGPKTSPWHRSSERSDRHRPPRATHTARSKMILPGSCTDPGRRHVDRACESSLPRPVTPLVSVSSLAPARPTAGTSPDSATTDGYNPLFFTTKVLLSWSCTDLSNPHYPRKRSTFTPLSPPQQ